LVADPGDTPEHVSRENIETIEAGFAAHNSGDLDALVELYDPDIYFGDDRAAVLEAAGIG
jgi:hypothetical protein